MGYFFKSLFLLLLFSSSLLNAMGYTSSNDPKITISNASYDEKDSGTKDRKLVVSIDECPNKSDIKLSYSTSDGTATTGDNDYLSSQGDITFKKRTNCAKSKNVIVKIQGDLKYENDENLTLSLSNNGTSWRQKYTIVGDGVLTILNDDKKADLSITKSVDNENPNVNDYITYTIIGKNLGPDQSKIEIKDTLAASLELDDSFNGDGVKENSNSFKCSVSGQNIVCNGARKFSSAEEVKVEIKVKVKDAIETMNDTNITSYSNAYDPDTSNNSASVTINSGVSGDNADLYLLENLAPTPNPAELDQNITFHVRLKTDGPSDSQGPITLKISYNKDITIESASQIAGGGDFVCDVTSGSLSAGSFIKCTKSNTLNSTAPNKDFSFIVQSSTDGTLTQNVIVETTTDDLNTSNNTLESSVTLNEAAIIENANDICYEDPFETDGICVDLGVVSGGFTCTRTINIQSLSSITNLETVMDASGFSGSMMSDCGVNGTSVKDASGVPSCKENSDFSGSYFTFMSKGLEYDVTDSLEAGSETSIYNYATFDVAFFKKENLYATYIKDGKRYRGKMKACGESYCKTNHLSSGFNVVDPDEGSDYNSFEIFCYTDSNDITHDLIALPIKNSSNNFLFNNESTSSNYYDESANPRTHFHALEINLANVTYDGTLDDGVTPRPHIPVVVSSDAQPYDIVTDGKNYKVMGSGFSNINLIGTPFTIEWDRTGELSGCNESKLRKGLGQAVKYNTINNGTSNDGKSRCTISDMTLSLLDDYRFLTYNDDEVLQHSCKEMASYIPNNLGVLSKDVAGHFNILTSEPRYREIPTTNGSRNSSNDIGDEPRPITVYCEYQDDLNYVWTFLTALDGEVTSSKNDLVNQQDTCSEFGLYFYVPDSKKTFDRVRKYLKSSRTEKNIGDGKGWDNYTGTIDEKIKSFHPGNEYYLPEFKDVKIWPYGPFGVYLHSGTKSAPRAPMHNIDTIDNYDSSMGAKGWVSILGTQDLNITNSWWISDIGAGLEITKPVGQHTYTPSGSHPVRANTYDEPNGNYRYDAWYNFLYDEEGWVYHNDDWDANYPYYDYMCMSETNYENASRYSLVPGFFNAIERGSRVENTSPHFSDTALRTKVVHKNIQLDVLLYKINNGEIDRTQLNTTENKSVGVFLSSIDEPNPPSPIKFLGTLNDFKNSNGRLSLDDFNISSAQKVVTVQFYYCNTAGVDWRVCWDYSNNNNSIVVTKRIDDAGVTDALDKFSIRPDRFDIGIGGSHAVKAGAVNVTYHAYDYISNDTVGYNEPFSSLSFSTTIADASKATICPNKALSIAADKFTDGLEINATKFSNVGKWNIKLSEVSGAEFAIVDSSDTLDSDRLITPADFNLTIIPSYFDINLVSSINNGNGFTYFSNDLDHMGINFDFNVTAKNSDGAITPNYSDGCYANPIVVDLKYSIVSSGSYPASFANKIIYKEINSSVNGESVASSNKLTTSLLPKSLFDSGSNQGQAKVSLHLNFKRDKNSALNPFKVTFDDLNVSDKTFNPVVTDTQNHTINRTATMLYGRTHGIRQIFNSNTGDALIYYEIYCSGTDNSGTKCNKSILLNGSTLRSSDDPRWLVNKFHDITKDGLYGKLSQIAGNGGVVLEDSTGTVSTTNGVVSVPVIYGTTANPAPKGYPYRTTVENNASTWLLYDKYANNPTTNQFQVEFVDQNNNWAGVKETDTTTQTNSSKRTNRRTMW